MAWRMIRCATTSVPVRGYVIFETPTHLWISSFFGTWIVSLADVVSREAIESADKRSSELIYLRHDAEIREP